MFEWHDEAKCRKENIPPNFFFPRGSGTIPSGRSGGPTLEDIENKHKLFCNDCPVKNPCLEYALETYQEGIWGGTTKLDRRDILRERRRKKAS